MNLINISTKKLKQFYNVEREAEKWKLLNQSWLFLEINREVEMENLKEKSKPAIDK